MNMETKYVKITAKTDQGKVYPVRELDEYHYRVDFFGGNAVILKQYCEPYEFPKPLTPAQDKARELCLNAIANILAKQNLPGHVQELEQLFPEYCKPVVTYKVGDRFQKMDGEVKDPIFLRLIQIDYYDRQAGLLCENTNCLYAAKIVTVGNLNAITEDELMQLVGYGINDYPIVKIS